MSVLLSVQRVFSSSFSTFNLPWIDPENHPFPVFQTNTVESWSTGSSSTFLSRQNKSWSRMYPVGTFQPVHFGPRVERPEMSMAMRQVEMSLVQILLTSAIPVLEEWDYHFCSVASWCRRELLSWKKEWMDELTKQKESGKEWDELFCHQKTSIKLFWPFLLGKSTPSILFCRHYPPPKKSSRSCPGPIASLLDKSLSCSLQCLNRSHSMRSASWPSCKTISSYWTKHPNVQPNFPSFHHVPIQIQSSCAR